MATRPAASWFLVLLSLISVQFGSAGETIRAEPGENAILPCEAPEKKPVIIVEWRRCDLEGNDHVALYQDEQFDNEGQNPAYKNRVDLQDREIKNGDVSLVLKNVTTNDTGTYECRVDGIKNKRRKRSHLKNEPICIINLVVSAPGSNEGQKKDGGNEEGQPENGGTNTGLIVGLSVLAVLALFAVSGFLLYKKLRRSSQEQKQPPAAEAELQAMNVENHPEPEM
ncbi:hepatitis A virus cellular receptor 2-like isoform X1 [Poecilia latipinna]|uniref:hepatitis A virus cellular receptor 2-like isoform X1 n=1 Tax=Poecilia latipinna TaxID=48699 RepID=UPI00072EA9B1|nr:PREDICTED: hepatitis A virus cellular receptor 2-like isoform X1 [Poecilia latipinna]